MPRLSALLFSTLFALSASAQTNVLLHLKLTDSAVASLASGKIRKIDVSMNQGRSKFHRTTLDDRLVATANGVESGTWKVHVFFTMGQTYMVYETSIDVPSSGAYETTLDVPALVVAGQVTNHGAPVVGQMNLSPSEHEPGSWGFAVPFRQDGRFEFPLPKSGQWDIDVWDHDRHHLAKIRGAEFNNAENDFDIATSPSR